MSWLRLYRDRRRTRDVLLFVINNNICFIENN